MSGLRRESGRQAAGCQRSSSSPLTGPQTSLELPPAGAGILSSPEDERRLIAVTAAVAFNSTLTTSRDLPEFSIPALIPFALNQSPTVWLRS